LSNSTLPLVVDLDGTLIKTNLLYEATSWFVTRHPLRIASLVRWMLGGRGVLNARLAEACVIEAAVLPYNDVLVAWLFEQKKKGRCLVLAAGSHRQLAESVAQHLACFDEVLTTEREIDLTSHCRRDLLISRFGEKGFDYVGSSASDLVVWQAANHAHVVSSSQRLISKVRSLGNIAEVFDIGSPPYLSSMCKALRPYQWSKNILVFVPLCAGHRYGDEANIVQTLLAFIVFCFTASSSYLLNDLADVADDRHHSRKRYRPFAAGHLSLLHGWLIWPSLLFLAFAIAILLMSPAFVGCLATYFVLTTAYSLRLKQSAAIDVLALAGLYTLRIVAGAAATDIPLSFWLMNFSMFIFLSLALMKRFSELKAIRLGSADRIRGRGYGYNDANIVSGLGTASGYIAVLVLALYVQDIHSAELYRSPKFIWYMCPLLLFWISRAWLIAHRGEMHDDPVIFALKDRVTWWIGACVVVVFGLATYIA